MARNVYGSRALLNLPGHHTTAAIVAEIENTSRWPEGKSREGRDLDRYNAQPEITCRITDCDNAVNIEFDVDTPNSVENSLHKIDTMIAALRAMRRGIVAEAPRAQKRVAAIPTERRYGL